VFLVWRLESDGFGRNDLANASWITVRWIDSSSALRESRQLTLELLELADPRADLSPTAFDELKNVSAWFRSEIADSDDVAYLSNRQPDGLGGADERQPRQDISRVLAIARRRPHGLGQ